MSLSICFPYFSLLGQPGLPPKCGPLCSLYLKGDHPPMLSIPSKVYTPLYSFPGRGFEPQEGTPHTFRVGDAGTSVLGLSPCLLGFRLTLFLAFRLLPLTEPVTGALLASTSSVACDWCPPDLPQPLGSQEGTVKAEVWLQPLSPALKASPEFSSLNSDASLIPIATPSLGISSLAHRA